MKCRETIWDYNEAIHTTVALKAKVLPVLFVIRKLFDTALHAIPLAISRDTATMVGFHIFTI